MLNDDLINHINNSCYGKNGEYCSYYNAEFTIRYDGNSIMGGLFRNVKTHRLYSVKDLDL